MRRLFVLLLFFAVSLSAAEVLDNATVIRLAAAGLSADVIVLKIERSQTSFDTSADALIALKKANVPDAVIRAMVLRGDEKSSQPVPVPVPGFSSAPNDEKAGHGSGHGHVESCVNASYFTTGNGGYAWYPASVCVTDGEVSIDEQSFPLDSLTAHCTSRPMTLAFAGASVRGQQEWWFSDGKDTYKLQGKADDMQTLADDLTRFRSALVHGSCGDRDVRRVMKH